MRLATAFLFLSAAVADDAPRDLDLFLLIGQSNMAGRGTVEPQDREPIPGVFAWGKDEKWIPAVDPLHWDKPEIIGVGVGRSFAQRLLEVNPKRKIGLIPAAFGGTSLEQWKVGGDLYTNAVKRAKDAMESGKLRGILWHQGEAESGREELAKSYAERWGVIMNSIRKDLNAANVPVVVGQLGTFLVKEKQPFADKVNEQLMNLPTDFKHTAFVPSAGLKHRGDQVHFDSEGLREFGRRYADAYLKLVKGK